MTIMWISALLVITVSGMARMLLRDKPKGLQANVEFLSLAAITSGALLSLAEGSAPSGHVVVFAWGTAALMAVRATIEIRRSINACH